MPLENFVASIWKGIYHDLEGIGKMRRTVFINVAVVDESSNECSFQTY